MKVSGNRYKSILMVLDAFYPNDIRLKKEIPELINEGYSVTLICYRRENEAENDDWKGCKIIRTRKSVGDWRKTFLDVYNSMFFTNLLLKKTLVGLNERFDVVHVHDLAASNTALRYARSTGSIAVLDMHENYPEAMKVWFQWRKGFIIRLKNKLFFTYNKWMKREKDMVLKFDYTIAVVDEMKERLITLHGAEADKLFVVSNTEPKALFQFLESDESNSQAQNIVYVGGIGPHRGLDTAIEAMPQISEKMPEARLVIVGSGNRDNINHLKAVAVQNRVEHLVEFKGQVPFEEAIAYMQGAFVNIIPHHSNDHTDNTIPHKLFQMLNSNYPVMVSSCKPLKRIIEEFDAGLVFEAGNPYSFAERILWASENPKRIKEMSQNGHAVVQEGRYNWETDAKILRGMYAEILKN